MNRFLTNSGEMPIWLGDIDYMNEAVRESLLSLVKMITGQEEPTCIISGCDVTTAGVSAGVVCLSGEIMPLEESNVVSPSYHLEINSSYQGERTFKDGTVHSAYEIRSAVAVAGATAILDKYILLQMPRVEELVARTKILLNERNLRIVQHGGVFYINGYVDITSTPAIGEAGYSSAYILQPLPMPMRSLPVTMTNMTAIAVNPRDGSTILANITLFPNFSRVTVSFTAFTTIPSGQYRFSLVVA